MIYSLGNYSKNKDTYGVVMHGFITLTKGSKIE